jgi:hypothetical protein
LSSVLDRVAALTNFSTSIYAKSQAEVEDRARELLAAHGVEV